MPGRDALEGLSRSELIDWLEDAAKSWLAHDGLWFQAVETHFGLEAAVQLDAEAWAAFTALEARRIMRRLGLAPGGGLPALARALGLRLYARINDQTLTWVDERTLRFEMNSCRVQEARRHKGLAEFACKPVGLVEYQGFAREIDPRLRTRCLGCPPDPRPEGAWCAWEFTLPATAADPA